MDNSYNSKKLLTNYLSFDPGPNAGFAYVDSGGKLLDSGIVTGVNDVNKVFQKTLGQAINIERELSVVCEAWGNYGMSPGKNSIAPIMLEGIIRGTARSFGLEAFYYTSKEWKPALTKNVSFVGRSIRNKHYDARDKALLSRLRFELSDPFFDISHDNPKMKPHILDAYGIAVYHIFASMGRLD